MVIIRVKAKLNADDLSRAREEIKAQAAQDGIIVLPHWCELLNEVPADEEIQIIHQDARVAELEQELARAMFYISAQKNCSTCKHDREYPRICDAVYAVCAVCDSASCKCKYCRDGSNWEWRGAHG